MKKFIFLLILICVCSLFSLFVPVQAKTTLRYGASQNNSTGARINYYPYKKPEPQVRYVYVNPYEKSRYDEKGYHLAENEPKKRGGSSKIIYNAFPLPRPNFGSGFVNSSSSSVGSVRTIRSGSSYRIGNGALRHPSVSYSVK